MATIYRYYNDDGQLLYVGQTRGGIARGFAHMSSSVWWRFVAFAEFHDCPAASASLIERLAIWTEQPLFNRAGRVSTAKRQAMRALVQARRPDELIGPRAAAEILGLSEADYRQAVSWGFIKTEYPRAMWTTHEQLLDFIGEIDPGPADPSKLIGWLHDEYAARLRDFDINRQRRS